MNIEIGNNTFNICALDPRLMLRVSDIPFSFFDVVRGKGIYEQMREQKKERDSGAVDVKVLTYFLKNGVTSMNGERFDVDLYLKTSSNILEAYELMGRIVLLSFKFFNQKIEIDMDELVTIDIVAKRYGKTPMEIMFPNEDYSAWDAFQFNVFVASHAIKREHQLQKEALKR